MTDARLLTGQLLEFISDPFEVPVEQAVRHRANGAILVAGGRIVATGEASALRKSYPEAEELSYGQNLILPGFVDAHAHYPQTRMIASWGLRLLDWLNTYTFPREISLNDPEVATSTAESYLDLLLDHGTTSVASFCTTAAHSADALFSAAETRGMAVVAGRTCMDRNAPEALCDSPQTAYDESAALIDRWHGVGRATYAISPRFAPTSTEAQLEALGGLWAENPTCLMQTHLSEQKDEIAWVADLYPAARDYLDVYETYGLVREGGLFGHGIWLSERERARLAETGASLIHCPTSNSFIGSGLFETAGRKADRIRVGLATDTGGGSSFSMLRTMAAAYEIGQLSGTALHAAHLLWLATEGSADALGMTQEIGTLSQGSMADLVVLNLASTPAIAQREAEANDIWEAVFPTIMMGDDRAIEAVWVAGIKHKG